MANPPERWTPRDPGRVDHPDMLAAPPLDVRVGDALVDCLTPHGDLRRILVVKAKHRDLWRRAALRSAALRAPCHDQPGDR